MDRYLDRTLKTVKRKHWQREGKKTKYVNAGNKSEPGVMLSSFFRALTAPGHLAILEGYLGGVVGGGVGEWSTDKKQKVLPTKRALQKCLERDLEKKIFFPPEALEVPTT